MIGLGLGIGISQSLGFNIASIFANGEQGVWLEPWDLTTMFQDYAGTIPVTAVGQPVGLRLDKSGNGNNALQTTATKRPIYGRVPATGKNNILANSVMAGGGAVPPGFSQDYATGTSAPYGTINGNTQYRHTATGSERPEFTLSAWTLGTTGSITASLFIDEVLAGSPTIVSMIYMSGPAGSTVAYFKNGDAANSTDLVSAGDRISAVLTSGGTSGAASARFGLGSGAVVDGDVVISRPMVNVGTTALNYQNSVSDYDTTEDGVQTLYGLKYDGIDDCYVTPSIDFTGTDKVTVWAGVRKLSDATRAILVELSSSVINAGSFNIEAPNNNNFPRFAFSLNGSATAVYQSDANQAAPANKVIQASFNIAGSTITDEIKHRINGASTAGSATVAGPAGTGNFGNYPLYIGSRGGTSLRFNGWEFGIIVRGAASNDTQIAAVEKLLNQHTGAY